ncbi:glutamine-synthetase adenylyltransferase [Neptunicoccus cionae]|uniref:Glutamate-ammonia-ligase adenylyltransferase n=1 Tax=Neptunicoccus cionae TaxID=2035344 RepID=A0A916VR39_9RHOB|nr:glutamine-synthetase adenylyltransferase [Amylibacter cionae]GGA24147.1 glutamate-ammonia-ligase adenylyltransferase [Amylibacter cionae]
MTLETQLKSAPVPYNPELAVEARERFNAHSALTGNLVAGMAGSSGYLRGLLQREADWFEGALGQEPEACFEALLSAIDPEDGANLGAALRIAKRRVALLLAACDLGGVWTLEQVTHHLTRFADFATDTALRSQIATMIARKKLPGCGPDDIADCAGIAVLAMGKMGAYELNYSSDIDLIVLFDDERHSDDTIDDVRMAFQRATRNMAKMLSEVTAEGYVFRTDLRLRPNPSVTPVCVPMDAAERYYESEGRTWERAAFIKARPCAGDMKAGAAFLQRIAPFVWRRHLDFAAIQDAHDMRLRIREHKGLGGPIEISGHDMKLGRGGIREIEFFAQTQQLIAGGRDAELRCSGTLDALAGLAQKGWVPDEVAENLTAAYRAHRTTEHRIQMLRDAQTHVMPTNEEGLAQVANLSGWSDVDGFLADQTARLQGVHDRIETLYNPVSNGEDGNEVVALDPALREQMDSWAALPALRSRRSVQIFERLRPEIERRIAGVKWPEFTLRQLDSFIRRLPAGVQLFSLFEANPQILDLLLDICSTAPGLAQYLARNTGVFDAVLSGAFFGDLPDADGYVKGAQAALNGVTDYEDALNTARRWQKEQHFRIGVLMLRRLAGLEEVERAYSDLATAVLRVLMPWIEADIIRRYGRFDQQSVSILAMGKLGSRQMTSSSDLDLILLYDVEGDMSDGRKGLSAPQYFARLTQAMIMALSSPMAEGELYEVDMRLRPSGRQGPVATSINGFAAYQRDEAWTWEHLALTRGRVVAGDSAKVDAVRDTVISKERRPELVREDVAAMRARLAAAKGSRASVWEVKDIAGGILDIELIAQMVALLEGSDTRDPRDQLSAAKDGEVAALADVHRLLCTVQQAQRLVIEGRFDPDKLGTDGMGFVVGFAGFESAEALESEILTQCSHAEAVIARILTPE